jgi:hypothetical protein
MLKVLTKRIMRGIRWIFRDMLMIIRAPKVSILSKIMMLFVYIAYHIFKVDFNRFRMFINVDGVEYRLISYDTLNIAYAELWMDRYLDVRDDQVFIDVGAHVGKYALRIAKRNPRSMVIAIEPGHMQFSALIEGIKENKLNNVIPLNIAAWDSTTRIKLMIYSATGTSSVMNMPGRAFN